MLGVMRTECQAWYIICKASLDNNQCFSKRNDRDIILSILLYHRDNNIWSDVGAERSVRHGMWVGKDA
jgi:hypothetical protein